MREVKSVLLSERVHYLHIFSFEKYSKLYKISDMSNKVGVNFDDNFLGIFSYKTLCELTAKIENEKNVTIVGIHINNVINHNLFLLRQVLTELDLPITVWIHDYSAICEYSPIMLTKKKQCCNNFSVDLRICEKCVNYRKSNIEELDCFSFYKSLDTLVDSVIAPSNSALYNVLKRYFFWTNKIHLRPHLAFDDFKNRAVISEPLRIAFLGGKYEHKGYKEWKELVGSLKKNNDYEFYYLGADTIDDEKNVHNIFVDVSSQGNTAMLEAVRNNNINVAFLWSKCQETYSYTYYEALCGGALVFTNPLSGNIKDEVYRNNTGLIFKNINELIEIMGDTKKLIAILNEMDKKYPSHYDYNFSTENLIADYFTTGSNSNISRYDKKVNRCNVLSLIYIVSKWSRKKEILRVNDKCKANR